MPGLQYPITVGTVNMLFTYIYRSVVNSNTTFALELQLFGVVFSINIIPDNS